MVLTDEERKAKRKEYNSTPEAKAKRKERSQRPETKAKVRAYKSTPEAKAKRKATRNKIENKVKEKEYRERSEVKAKALLNSVKPERKAKKKEYSQKYNATYYSTPESKAKRSTPEYKAYLKKYQKKDDDQRLKILLAYSKRHSNSDIPCCNCCGLNEYLDFLALDHVLGKKQMDSIPELIAIGYSSQMVTKELFSWIMRNNFPDGFQILCHNCNFAKGYPRNNGKCPHEK
jgi:hypothetical protein